MNLKQLITQQRLMVDGGMGTLLQAMGLEAGQRPETWNIDHPDRVESVHRDYLAAGCDIITANTFGASALHFGDQTEAIIQAGIAIARKAVREAGHGWVAMDLGPTGKLLQPFGDLPFEEAVSLYHQAARAGAEAGANLIIIETMADSYELKAAVLGAKEGCDLPIVTTLMMNENGKVLTGGDIPGMVAMLESLGVTALGLNCGLGPAQMKPLAEAMLACASIPLWCCPNAGLPQVIDGQTRFTLSPEAFASEAAELCRMGVSVIGGCCGTTPVHLALTAQACRKIPLPVIEPRQDCVLCSHNQTVTLGKTPVVIGERINPTGKKAFKEALKAGDLDYILREAISQAKSGAHLLDVNVGLPGIDEAAWMKRAVTGIQSICALPLQLDTADPVALEAALRLYNGKALVNSVSAKQESMDVVFPLVKKYGGAVVCLLLDESGIPETSQGRIDCARRIIACAESYGIAKKDLVMDALTLTVSTGGDNAAVTLDTLRRLKTELGVCTVLGVSNISFGLPQRERLNAAFLAMAIEAGLDAAIVNPLSENLMSAYHAACALTGKDPQFAQYLARYAAQTPAAPASPKAEFTLPEAVLQGLEKEAAKAAAQQLTQGQAPLDIVSSQLMPALDQVGRGFEKGTLFLPQLLMSAEAAKAAFAVIQAALQAGEEAMAKTGRIILATVKGDVHDIGKNIVKVLLENYNFEIIDLGKDVPPETILETARERDVTLVGLSALMTTTLPAMEETVALLAKELPQCRVMVGGAVLTQDYADAMGAHCYAPDAMAAVVFAQKHFGTAI